MEAEKGHNSGHSRAKRITSIQGHVELWQVGNSLWKSLGVLLDRIKQSRCLVSGEALKPRHNAGFHHINVVALSHTRRTVSISLAKENLSMPLSAQPVPRV